MNEKNSSKQILLSVLGVAILVVAVVGVSFAAFSWSGTEVSNTLETGELTMTYTEGENGISITNMLPTTDDAGKALKATDGDGSVGGVFDFQVSARMTPGANNISYTISAKKDDEASQLENNEVKLYLETLTSAGADSGTQKMPPSNFTPAQDDADDNGMPSGEMKLTTGTFEAQSSVQDQTHYYRLKMWVASDYQPTGSAETFKVRVNVYAKSAALNVS